MLNRRTRSTVKQATDRRLRLPPVWRIEVHSLLNHADDCVQFDASSSMRPVRFAGKRSRCFRRPAAPNPGQIDSIAIILITRGAGQARGPLNGTHTTLFTPTSYQAEKI